jgi:signal transduction histidine kinase
MRFLYGLTAFTLALVVLLRGRRTSRLALGRHFIWLSAFGFMLSAYSWSRMFSNTTDTNEAANVIMMVTLPVAGVMLVRFGIGLIADAGHLPNWLPLVPLVVFVPLSLLVAYGLVIIMTTPLESGLVEWSGYLLFFPGNLLAAFGCLQQWRRLKANLTTSILRETLLVAAAAFLLNGIISGLMTTSHNILHTGTMMILTVAVVGMMRLFEVERQHELQNLEDQHRQAQDRAVQIRLKMRQESAMWLDNVVSVSRLIANMESEDKVLCTVVTAARQAVDSDIAVLALRDEDYVLTLRYQATTAGSKPLSGVVLDNPSIIQVIRTGEEIRFDNQQEPFIWNDGHQQWQIKQAAVVPLMLNGVAIGVLWTGRCDDIPFTCGHLVGLGHLANQAVIALEHATMAARLQSLAIIEERSRIAREMHDGLAQILGYLGVEMQTLEALVRQGNTDAVLDELANARREIKSAHADVRQNILSLRTTLSQDIDLKQALQTYVQEFGIQTGIQTIFLDHTENDLTLSPLAEAQLTRIIQEALTNVRKHANASVVHVEITSEPGWLHVSVIDNGIGIQPDQANSSQFGLQTMRERAEQVDGRLTIDSSIAAGTTIELDLPLL